MKNLGINISRTLLFATSRVEARTDAFRGTLHVRHLELSGYKRGVCFPLCLQLSPLCPGHGQFISLVTFVIHSRQNLMCSIYLSTGKLPIKSYHPLYYVWRLCIELLTSLQSKETLRDGGRESPV
jgi:hypothetical protein